MSAKMRSSPWLVMGSTFVIYIVAFGLAAAAETQRSKATKEKDQYEYFCQYTHDKASGLAIGAVISLLVAQAIVMALTSCLCCGSGTYKPGKARVWAIIFFSLSWATFIIAELCLLVGARLNTIRTHSIVTISDDDDLEGDLHCKQVKKSLFGAGAAFTFLTLLFAELYYFSVTKASEGSWQQSYHNGAPTIGMGPYP